MLFRSRGNTPRENKIKQALFEQLKDKTEVERIFLIIQEHTSEY